MDVRVKSEKEEMLDKKIEEVRKRNEARLKKFREAEEDRKRAEEAGRAVNLKNSTFSTDDDDYHKYRGPKTHNPKNESQKSRKSGVSNELKAHDEDKNRINSDRGDNEENNNNNNNNSGQANCNNPRKERTPKTNIRAIYVPKHLQNRDSPENVKPPPPDPKNSFLADSYRTPSSANPRPEDHPQPPYPSKEHVSDPRISIHADNSKNTPKQMTPLEFSHRGSDPRKQQIPASSQSTFHCDARQRINQLKALRNQENQGTPFSSLPIARQLPASEPCRSPPQHRNRPHNFKHNRRSPLTEAKPVRDKKKESPEKPIKSILKKPKELDENFDDSQPIIAVITTPGDDTYEEEGNQGYNWKKEEAICDWLKNSEFSNEVDGDDDEWEDVDEDEDSISNNHSEPTTTSEVKNEVLETKTQETTPIPTSDPKLENDGELEAFEEDNAAFQEFIQQHTLTLDGKGGFDWATEMERLSLENKRKIDPEVLEKAASKD